MLPALLPTATAHARPLTTKPLYALSIHVTITDTRIVLDRHSAPRGVEARFVLVNAGTRAHNFTLKGGTTSGGARRNLSRTLEPHQRRIVQIFLDRRSKIPYFGALPSDRGKTGMRGFFLVK
jgi:hypothetical protein